jgi:hypothetical protein
MTPGSLAFTNAVSSLQAATKSCSRPDLTVMREINVIRDIGSPLVASTRTMVAPAPGGKKQSRLFLFWRDPVHFPSRALAQGNPA